MTEQESKQLLLKALAALDSKLASTGCSPVEIRIVGGAKIVAAGDTLLVRDDIEHERHARDLVALLKSLNIDSIEKLTKTAPLAKEYPELLRLLFP